MIHLSQATVSLMEAATGMKIPNIINRQDLESIPSALTKDSVTYFVTLSYDYATQALENFDISKGYQYVKRGKFNETRIAWILKAFEHQAHHRGQTTIYIRALGLKPPNERLLTICMNDYVANAQQKHWQNSGGQSNAEHLIATSQWLSA